MAVQIAETAMPRGKKSSERNTTVVYAEVPVWLKNAVEDEVIYAKRNARPAESLTSFTEDALTLLVNLRRADRGLPPIEPPSEDS